MLLSRAWSIVAQYTGVVQDLIPVGKISLSAPIPIDFAISQRWSILGPFQIGTRESPWSADPLELYGGFHSLEYDPHARFKSSLAFNGSVRWLNFSSELSYPSESSVQANLAIDFLPTIDWPFLQDVYGWAGHQWLGWARGEIEVKSDETKTLALNTRNVLEFWIDDTRYFGGDFYGYGRAGVTLHLTPGPHTFDVKLVGDVRAVGGVGDPIVDVSLYLTDSSEDLRLLTYTDKDVLISDVVGGDLGPLASPYASVILRNDAQHDIYVLGFEGMGNVCIFEFLKDAPIKIVPGQTRPIGFRLGCVTSYKRRLMLDLKYRVDGEDRDRSIHISTIPKVIEDWHTPHKITYVHPSGVVSYAILRPPSINASCGCSADTPVPVMVGLHGAAVNADDYDVMHSMDRLPDLCAWYVLPQGTTPWSGDDWHSWGFADVESAVLAIPDWIERVEWTGPGVDVKRWLMSGHSNGGQGVWYAVTHRPDYIMAAAALSGYSSIQNYVPYTSWRTADPGRTAIVQASMSSYRHDLLIDNIKGIPMILQHGSKDDNVPAYHSRLMDSLLEEAGAESQYIEIPDVRHVWEGMPTTKPLRAFYKKYLDCNETSKDRGDPVQAQSFSIVVANPGDMGTKNGINVLKLTSVGQLGRLDFTFDPLISACILRSSNVEDFIVSTPFDNCDQLWIDGQDVTSTPLSTDGRRFFRTDDGWRPIDSDARIPSKISGIPAREGRQFGPMDAVIRTRGAFKIVRHSKNIEDLALQVSRNLCQYFTADTEVTDDYEEAIKAEGNVISLSIGGDMPDGEGGEYPYPVTVKEDVTLRDGNHLRVYSERGFGLAAIFLRPLPNERLHLVVWGYDRESLEMAARLVPMMTGSGQPDFIVTDRSMMWKGLQGTLALGFFDWTWEVSRNSYFT